MRILCVLISIFTLVGCVVGRDFYQYPGAPRPLTEESSLYIADGDSITIQNLDGEELANPYTTLNGGYSAVREIHVLPGEHTVDGIAAKGSAFISYNVAHDYLPGRRYRLTAEIDGYQILVRIIEAQKFGE